MRVEETKEEAEAELDLRSRAARRRGVVPNGQRPFVLMFYDGQVVKALLDAGAEVEAILPRSLARAPTSSGGEVHRLAVFGGGVGPAVLGNAPFAPTVLGRDGHGRGVTMQLAAVDALVVDRESLSTQYDVLVGARMLRRLGGALDFKRAVWTTAPNNAPSHLAVAFVEPGALRPTDANVQQDEAVGELAGIEGDAVVDVHAITALAVENTSPAPPSAAADACDGRLSTDLAMEIANVRGAIEELQPWTERRPSSRAPLPPQATRQRGAVVPIDPADTPEAVMAQLHRDADEEARARQRALADEELAEKTALAQRWATQLRAFGEAITPVDPVLGEAVQVLDADQRARFAELLGQAAPMLCDPRRRPREPQARPLPVAVTLEVLPDARPTREGYARQMTLERQLAAAEQLDTLLAGQLVEIAERPEWVHAVVLAKKKDGRWRFAIDYRPLNRVLRPQQYPLPDVEEMLRVLAQHELFATYDLADAFYQVSLAPPQRPLTAFHVPGRGTFQWKVLPMGMQPATAVWQANVERVLAPVLGRGVFCFVDDLVVYANTAEELLAHTRNVHALLRAHDLRVAPRKVQLCTRSVSFLGRTVSKGHIAIDERHSQALREYERPSTIKDLQRLLGMANYHRKFILRLADRVSVLTAWEARSRAHARQRNPALAAHTNTCDLLPPTDLEMTAFRGLLDDLGSPPVLTIPDMGRLDGRVRIETDAVVDSDERSGGIGAGVYWRDDGGEWRLVAAHSRVLKDAERRYAPVEVEMLGVMEALRHSEWLISKAARVEVVTDHAALTYLDKLATTPNGRLARWAARLLQFDLELTYRPGADNVAADAWSRAAPGQYAREGRIPVSALLRPSPPTVATSPSVEATPPRPTSEAAVEEVRPRTSHAGRVPSVAPDIRDQLRGVADGSYDVMFVDYPWRHDADATERWFRRMDDDEWGSLQLNRILAPQAVLFIAVSDCLLPKAMRVLEQHGWTFRRTLQWRKDKSTPSRRWPRCTWEHVVVATRGDRAGDLLSPQAATLVGEVSAPVREPARKPDELFDLFDAMLRSNLRRAELFARESRDGWDAYGDQCGLFDAEDAPARAETDAVVPTSVVVDAIVQSSELSGDAPDEEHRLVDTLLTSDEQWRARVLCAVLPLNLPGAGHEWGKLDKETKRAARRFVARHLDPSRPVDWVIFDHRRAEKMDAATRSMVALMEADRPRRLGFDPEADRARRRPGPRRPTNAPLVAAPALVHRDGCWVLPTSAADARASLLRRLHQSEGHVGLAKLLARLPRTGWFVPGRHRVLRAILRECETCQVHKAERARHAERGQRLGAPAAFGHHVHMDHVGPFTAADGSKRWVLSMTDALTRWPEAVVVTAASAAEAARAFHRDWVCRYGPPQYLTTDRGSAFTSELLRALCATMRVRVVRTTPYHPHSNGLEERGHASVLRVLRRLAEDSGAHDEVDDGTWLDLLPIALRVMRATVHRGTGFTPARLVLGYELPLFDGRLETPRARALVDAGVVRVADLTSEPPSTQGELTPLMQLREEDIARAYARVWDLMADELAWRVEEARERQPMPAEEPSRSDRVVAGDYVRIAEPSGPRRWSKALFRVNEVIRGVSLVLAPTTDFLATRVESALRCKRTLLPEAARAAYEEEFAAVRAQVRAEARRWSEDFQWRELDEEEEKEKKGKEKEWKVERLTATRNFGAKRGGWRVRVVWVGGEETWEPVDKVREDVPGLWARLQRQLRREARARKQGGKKK